METIRIQSGAAERVYFLLLDASGTAVTGLAGAQLNMLMLLRKSDSSYWSGLVWGESSTNLAVIEQSVEYSPGLYYYTTPALDEDEYIVTADTTYADNVPQVGQIKVGGYVDNIDYPISDLGTQISGVATAVWAVGTRTLTSFGTLVSDIATAVWESLESSYNTVEGSFGDFFTKVRKYILNRKSPKGGNTAKFVVYEDDGETIGLEYYWKKEDGTAFDPTGKDMPAEQDPRA